MLYMGLYCCYSRVFINEWCTPFLFEDKNFFIASNMCINYCSYTFRNSVVIFKYDFYKMLALKIIIIIVQVMNVSCKAFIETRMSHLCRKFGYFIITEI